MGLRGRLLVHGGNAIERCFEPAKYHQVTLSQYYSLSKRTGLYAVEAYQHASGNTISGLTGGIVNATTSIGDGVGAGSKQNQIGLGVGLIHRF